MWTLIIYRPEGGVEFAARGAENGLAGLRMALDVAREICGDGSASRNLIVRVLND